MKFKELKNLNRKQAELRLEELRQQSHELAVKIRLNQVKNTHSLGRLKKDVARVITYLKEMQQTKAN